MMQLAASESSMNATFQSSKNQLYAGKRQYDIQMNWWVSSAILGNASLKITTSDDLLTAILNEHIWKTYTFASTTENNICSYTGLIIDINFYVSAIPCIYP